VNVTKNLSFFSNFYHGRRCPRFLYAIQNNQYDKITSTVWFTTCCVKYQMSFGHDYFCIGKSHKQTAAPVVVPLVPLCGSNILNLALSKNETRCHMAPIPQGYPENVFMSTERRRKRKGPLQSWIQLLTPCITEFWLGKVTVSDNIIYEAEIIKLKMKDIYFVVIC
jgi:hypothetical protein